MGSLFSAQEQKPREEERKVCQVVVRGPTGENMTINLCDTEEQMKSMTVLQLKKKIVERLSDDYDEDNLRLIFRDKTLGDDSKRLSDYGIEHMSVIVMVSKITAGGPVGMGHGEEGKNRSMEKTPINRISSLNTEVTSSARDTSSSTAQETERAEMGRIYQVFVRRPKGENITINLCNTEEQMKSMTVLQLKEKILETLHYDEENTRLIFRDNLNDNSKLLSDYGIKHMSVIYMVLRLPGGGSIEMRDGGMGDKESKNRSMEMVCSL